MNHITLNNETNLSAENIIARLDAILKDMDGIEKQIRDLGFSSDADMYSLSVKHLEMIELRLQRVVEEYRPINRDEQNEINWEANTNR